VRATRDSIARVVSAWNLSGNCLNGSDISLFSYSSNLPLTFVEVPLLTQQLVKSAMTDPLTCLAEPSLYRVRAAVRGLEDYVRAYGGYVKVQRVLPSSSELEFMLTTAAEALTGITLVLDEERKSADENDATDIVEDDNIAGATSMAVTSHNAGTAEAGERAGAGAAVKKAVACIKFDSLELAHLSTSHGTLDNVSGMLTSGIKSVDRHIRTTACESTLLVPLLGSEHSAALSEQIRMAALQLLEEFTLLASAKSRYLKLGRQAALVPISAFRSGQGNTLSGRGGYVYDDDHHQHRQQQAEKVHLGPRLSTDLLTASLLLSKQVHVDKAVAAAMEMASHISDI
jgi:hypothetical protein